MNTVNLPRTVQLGGGSIDSTADILAAAGLSRPLIITDPFLQKTGLAERLSDGLRKGNCAPGLFSGTVPDPTVAVVEQALDVLDADNYDCVIGLGGGSPIDTAKAVAALAVDRRPIPSLKAPALVDRPGLPIIAIPTTAGTGSEATRVCVLTDEASGEKMMCMGLAFLPSIAIIDFELTLSKPRRLTADTGIDALTHAVEAYVSKKANPFSDAMALSAMRLIAPNIRTACEEPDNRQAREAMMVGAHHAGIAFSNASVALVHGMSRPIGAFFHVPHGLSNAMLMPAVTAFSAPSAIHRYADCAREMGIAGREIGDQAACALLVDELQALNHDLDVPTPSAFGIAAESYDESILKMVEQAFASGSPNNNPRIPTAEEMTDLYRRIYA